MNDDSVTLAFKQRSCNQLKVNYLKACGKALQVQMNHCTTQLNNIRCYVSESKIRKK